MMNRRKRRSLPAFLRHYGRVLIGGLLVMIVFAMAVFAPLLATHDPYTTDMAQAKQTPDAEHWFGTDHLGRDIYSRVIYGSRITLIVALSVQALAIVFGTVLGLLCGYYKKFDAVCSRIMEGLAALPQLLLALAIAALLGEGTFNVIFSLVICALPSIVRAVRSLVLSIREQEFIEREKAIGASDFRTIFRHILPHCKHFLLIRIATGISGTISTQATLAFLGVGLDPTIPSWGASISDGQAYLFFYPHMSVIPGIVISLAVFGFTMLGEGLRDILDPKLR